MTLLFQVEKLHDVAGEIYLLLPRHLEELGAIRDAAIDPQWDIYERSAVDGSLFILTARNEEGELVGYYVAFVEPHRHYKQVMTAFADLYYLHPDYRQGTEGLKFMRAMEEELTKRGVVVLFTTTTTREDKSAVLERLGYHKVEMKFMKRLGGDHGQ